MSRRVERMAQKRVQAVVEQLAALTRDAVPRAEVDAEGDGVVIRGRGMRDAPSLRWIGGMLR